MISRWRHGTNSVPGTTSVTAGTFAFAGSLFGGFDGSFVALLPEEVHPPRHDEVYDLEWGRI